MVHTGLQEGLGRCVTHVLGRASVGVMQVPLRTVLQPVGCTELQAAGTHHLGKSCAVAMCLRNQLAPIPQLHRLLVKVLNKRDACI